MTSSMLSGDRRWASARRGAMTVLGKVPKPINLPSQRLENHGMDPSVEIVPKGTLSWGSKSSSASNAWGTTSLSPNTDGGTTSPSYLSGHISSGSGTRPSTAGSDKSHEPTSNAWGPNSRPSSASGVLTSNQTSLASLRPRSAEPRPGSSQLSRFAEHSEHPVAWNAPGTAEKLGVTSSKNEEFSLTSRDFPTLGSEKDNSGKNADSQDHSSYSRPGSSSGGGLTKETPRTSVVGDISANASVKSGTVNSWKRENHSYNEDGSRPGMEKWRENPSYKEDGGRPGMEKWRENPQPYPGASVPPQHYDAWHGGPVHPQGGPVPHPQGGVWFRGPPGGPPFGAQVPPGGFPMEPYPYYPPQIPAGALANPQPVPPTGGGPRGHHPKNGEMYRPHIPEAYIRPGMPIRPGFYPGPVPFEGYYGSPMGYCNSNERDAPFVGMPAGPPVYNRYPSQSAPEPGRPSGYGPSNQTGAPEKIESSHPHDTRGPYKVLLKQHDGWDRRNEEQRIEGAVTTNASCLENEDQPRAVSSENDWRSDRRKEGERDRRGERPTSQNSDRGASSARVKVKSPESLGNMRAADTIPVKKLETEACGTQDITQTLSAKDSSLIQKIEGLNAKARVSDGRGDTGSVSSREDQRKTFQVNPKTNSSVNEPGSGSGTEIINSSHEVSSGISVSRRPIHGMHGRSENRGRGRYNNQEGDGLGKKSFVSEPTSAVSNTNVKVHSNDHVHDNIASMEAIEKPGSYPQGRREDDSLTPMFDPNDSEAQRAKMRELAKQRTRQLQEEEEERTRRQMAKARAKLEELNRRTQLMEGSNKKFDNSSSGDIQIKEEESQTGEPLVAVRKHDSQVPALASNPNAVAHINESSSVKVEKSTVPSIELPPERPKSAYKEPIFMHDQPVPLQQQVTIVSTAHHNTSPQAHDNSISRQKQTPKQKQNTQLEKKYSGKNTSTSVTDTPNSQTDAVVNVPSSGGVGATSTTLSTEPSLSANASAVPESSSHPRKKSNRSGKNKQRAEHSSVVAAIPSSVSNETVNANTTIESGKPNASKVDLDPSSVQSQALSRDAYQSTEQNLSLPNEESQGKSGQWKSQHARRMPRNSQAVRHSEKSHSNDAVIWAPVRSQIKTDITDDTNPKTEAEGVSAVKGDHQVQNNSRNKRAEMERYVPKPIAKEMAHQGSTQQAVVSVVQQTATNENIRGADSGPQSAENSQPSAAAVGKAGFGIDSKNGSNRQNKQGKAHGSWRQRGSTEPTNMQGFQDGPSYTSNVGQSDLVSVTEQPKNSDDWNDGWNMPEEPTTVVPVSASIVVKEQGIPGRRKQHPYKGQKTGENNHDHEQKKNYGGDADRVYSKSHASEMSQTDLPSSSKENQAVGERPMPHWQPKSQAFAASNHRGNRGNGSQGGDLLSPTPDKDTTENLAQHRHDQYKSEKNNAGEGQNRRERKTTHKGRPSSPHKVPVSPVELAPPSMDARQEHQFQTGYRRNGNQNNRFSRGQESRGDWNNSGHDGRQQNPPANRDRQRHSSHLEYQPVGPYNSSDKFNNSEGPREGFQNSGGGRVKERGQGHSRRGGGNFHGRQSGSARVVQDME